MWCGFACLEWRKLTLTPSSVFPRTFLFGLKRTQYQKLSSGLMLVSFITTYIFQFGFADTEQYWHPSWLIHLTFIRTADKHIPLAPNCRVLKKKKKPCVVWFHVDTIAWFSQEVRRWFEDDFGSELVFPCKCDVYRLPKSSMSRCRVNWCGSGCNCAVAGCSRHRYD